MTLGSHQTTVGKSQVHITPKWIIGALGRFDLDPCAADPRPWNCARRNFTEAEDGLSRSWHGRVFLNPPFDRYQVGRWIKRLAQHGRGTALLHARTEAGWFEPIWKSASAILFLADRIHFHRFDGSRHPANSGAPAVLISFGERDLALLKESGIAGVLITQWTQISARSHELQNRESWEGLR
jgi:DNA N-6-adenine-methyltransferase (Dam)